MAALLGLLTLCAVVSADKVAVSWPTRFVSTSTRNASYKSGEMIPGYELIQKTYAYDLDMLKYECQRDGVTSFSIIHDQKAYVYNTMNNKCSLIPFLPVALLKPDWMADAKYIGQKVITDSKPSDCFFKDDHVYCQSVYAPYAPTHVYLPSDQRGLVADEYYNTFVTTNVTDADFVLPASCSNPDLPPIRFHFDCPEDPYPSDPACCFLPMVAPVPGGIH